MISDVVQAKPFYTSWTFWFNLLGLVVYLLGEFLDNYHLFGIALPAAWLSWLGMAAFLGNLALRWKTNGPIAASTKLVSVPRRGTPAARPK